MRTLISRVFAVLLCFVAACQKGDPAPDLKVTNGIVASAGQFENVVEISGRVLVSGSMTTSYCTGTFITKKVLITAAHCAYGHDTTGVEHQPRIYYNGVAAEVYITHPYKEWDRSPSPKIDLAIAVFKNDAAPANVFSKVSLAKVSKGDQITIAGFGVNDAADSAHISSGIKRYGYNVVDAVRPGEIFVKGVVSGVNADGKDSATGVGDSGGPIYNDQGDIIAVTSAGRILNGEKISYLTALDSDYSRKVLCVASGQNVVIPGFAVSECADFPVNKVCDYKYNTNNVLTGVECK